MRANTTEGTRNSRPPTSGLARGGPGFLWKRLLHRAVTGRWERMRLEPFGDITTLRPKMPRTAGLYLHVPFCRSLCPFCPYNRQQYNPDAYSLYERAVCQEMELRAPEMADTRIVSLYLGGGTPTVDPEGLFRILRHLRKLYPGDYPICAELHPSHMDDECLATLKDLGVTQVSIGVESTSDRLLKLIGRSHDSATAMDSVARAVKAGFTCVNVDLMFSLPTQTLEEWRRDLSSVLSLGPNQISTYPLFGFPYSDHGLSVNLHDVLRPSGRKVRSMLRAVDVAAHEVGLERCAVWSWVRPGGEKFSSVARHYYVGFGPSAASMTGSAFTVNTFDLDAYASQLPSRRPVALAMTLDRRLEMAYWLYWKAYELKISSPDFAEVFCPDASLDDIFGRLLLPFRALGMINRQTGGYRVTDRGAYWIHRIQTEYSLNYIDHLWGACRRSAWPGEIVL